MEFSETFRNKTAEKKEINKQVNKKNTFNITMVTWTNNIKICSDGIFFLIKRQIDSWAVYNYRVLHKHGM